MPIALGANSSEDRRAVSPEFVAGMTRIPMHKSPEFSVGGRRGEAIMENDDGGGSSSSSSSIGRNSDESAAGGDADGDGAEVQSSAKDGALGNLEDLEEALPLKRGLSKFYDGKSKSFTRLSDISSCSSLKDIVKPENAYSRKRKNLLAFNNRFGINSSYQHSCGIYKKPTNSTSSLAATINSNPSLPGFSLPPLPSRIQRSRNECSSSTPEQKITTWQSLSSSDLQGDAAPIPSITNIKE
nr:serine/arginine repetitive matrix protein 2-like [Ipomoea batatas]